MNKGVQLHDKDGNNIYPLAYYPVGAIFISTNSTNPSSYFGGTWQQIKDTFLLACGSKYKNGETGGESEHKLTVDEMPNHTHGTGINESDGFDVHITDATLTPDTKYAENGSSFIRHTLPTTTGGDKPHNNMPPYLAVYVWKRTA